MRKNYFLITIFALTFLISLQGFSQQNDGFDTPQQQIEGLSIYPNPVNENRQFIYITTKKNFTKNIEIFNVLGKQIYSTVLVGKELGISSLSTGVYILKITENNVSETRKLVIK